MGGAGRGGIGSGKPGRRGRTSKGKWWKDELTPREAQRYLNRAWQRQQRYGGQEGIINILESILFNYGRTPIRPKGAWGARPTPRKPTKADWDWIENVLLNW